MIAEKMRNLGMEVIDPVLRIQYQPVEKDLDECKRLGKDIAVKMKKKDTKAEPKCKEAAVSVREVKMGEGGH